MPFSRSLTTLISLTMIKANSFGEKVGIRVLLMSHMLNRKKGDITFDDGKQPRFSLMEGWDRVVLFMCVFCNGRDKNYLAVL